MECDRYPENGQGVSAPQVWACGVKRKLTGGLRLGSAGVRGAGAALLARSPRRRTSPRPSPRAPLPRVVQDAPFMNSMDEITYWIETKRAPCLAGLEHLRQPAARPCPSTSPDPEPQKKRRRLIPIGDASETTERPSAFLKTPNPKCETLSSEKSDTLVSDVDFDIKNSSVQAKNKKTKNRRNNRTTLHKKNKVVTSTPNVTSNLRRSLRKAQFNLNNNSHLNNTFEILKMTTANGIDHPTVSNHNPRKLTDQIKPSNLAGGDQDNKKKGIAVQKPGNGILNGQFEDLSDVSGFTANYIKSTKINSKNPRKLRTKQSRTHTKESRQNIRKEEKSLIVSISKGVNTGDPKATILNCSTDSSQNIINLVTMTKDSKSNKVDKSTSLLKFMDSTKGSKDVNTNKESRCGALDTSFQSTSTTGSRYPTRNKTCTEVTTTDNYDKTVSSKQSFEKKKMIANDHSSKSVIPVSYHSENTDALSRTRSGRSIGPKHADNTVFVFNNSTEQVSSVVTMNVASHAEEEPRDNLKKRRVSSKCGHARKSLNKTRQSTRDSFREKSGFAACFSDSDDDKPLKPQKYLS